MKYYQWQSKKMGNIVRTFKDVLKQMWESLVKYHTLDIRWKRIASDLPTFIYVATTYVDKEWDKLSPELKEEAVSDHLSDTYGFCHKGFSYRETDGVIHITDIEWDTEE